MMPTTSPSWIPNETSRKAQRVSMTEVSFANGFFRKLAKRSRSIVCWLAFPRRYCLESCSTRMESLIPVPSSFWQERILARLFPSCLACVASSSREFLPLNLKLNYIREGFLGLAEIKRSDRKECQRGAERDRHD